MAGKYSLDKKSIEYLSGFINVTDNVIKEIEDHARAYRRKAEISAWYEGMNDFRSEWCDDMGYREDEIMAQVINHDGQYHGEFMFLKNAAGIVRFAGQSCMRK